MAKFWRPFDFDEDDQTSHEELVAQPTKRRRLHVSTKEEEIVLEAYSKYSGWDEILEDVKQRVCSKLLSGNLMKIKEIKDYYSQTPREVAIKRIRRIVSQNVQKVQKHENNVESSQSVRMSKTILETKTRYSKKSPPEERAASKLSYAAHLSSHSSSSDENTVVTTAQAILPKDDQLTQDIKLANEASQKKRKKGRQRGKQAKDAHQAHTQMCAKAMKMMDKMDKILDKFDESEDETD